MLLFCAAALGASPAFPATLTGSFSPVASGSNVDLTAIGTLDWAHWGLNQVTDFNKKTNATPFIGTLITLGTGAPFRFPTNPVAFSWTDGSPTLAVTNSPTGIAVAGLTNGFQLSLAAGTERRRLYLYAAAKAAVGFLEAELSDASAPPYYDDSLHSATMSNGVFVIDFAAASPGQTLILNYTVQSLSDVAGFVSVQAAAIASNLPPTAALTSPTNNAKFFRSAPIPLSASATDADGAVQRVEFYRDAFKLAEVLAPPYEFVWEGADPALYSLTARAVDIDGTTTTSAPVNITVLNNFAPAVALTNPPNFSAFVAPTNINLVATASDIDGSVAKVEFFAGPNKLGETTTSPYTLTWTNPAAGEYFLTARATDNLGASNNSASLDIFVTQTGGFLAASNAIVTDPVDLDSEGPVDWAHWGLFNEESFDHKRGVTSQISDYSQVGGGGVYPYSDNANTYSWSDGSPTASATNTPTGIYIVGQNNGFHIQAPAGVTTNLLKVFVGAFAARGRLLAYLSDFSAPVLSDFSVDNAGNGPSTVYTLRYASATPGKFLHVRFFGDTLYDQGVGNVTLQAAALDAGNHPPWVSITNPIAGATFVLPANLSIQADANDQDGTLTNVEFFRDGAKFGQLASPPYSLSWSNVPPGRHLLAARATDNQGSSFMSRDVEVFVIAGGGAMVVSSAFPGAQLNLSDEGTQDWAHWGFSRATSFDHRLGSTSAIANVTRIGGGQTKRYADNFTAASWTNGTPTPTAAATPTGIFIAGVGNGFQVTAPADTSRRRLKIYVGLFAARGRFEASLSDNSARSFIDTSLFNVYGNNYRVYTLDYKAASPGQQLIIRHTADQVFDAISGNVTIQSATSADLPPARLLNPVWDGASLGFRFPTLSNWSYTVEYSEVLPATNWHPLATFPGTGQDIQFSDPFPGALQRFYRVVER